MALEALIHSFDGKIPGTKMLINIEQTSLLNAQLIEDEEEKGPAKT